ncbi:MAG: hypothetical protein Q4E17_02600 [Synergistes sp.]|nr:hypothetical protein [Synergistes sp.]
MLSGITNESLSAIFTEDEKQKEEIHVNDFMKKMFANAKAEGKAEGEARGRAEGRAEGEVRGQQKTAFNLRNMGMEEGFIAKAVGVTEAVIRKWFAEGQKVAML